MNRSNIRNSSGLWLGVVAAMLLSACASNRVKQDYTDYAGEPVRSFYMEYFGGWNPVSRDQLVVFSGMNKAYLLSLSGFCPNLQHATTIAVTSTGHTVDKFEKVIVGRDRCLIKEIRPVDLKQMKEDRKLILEQQRAGTLENTQSS